MLEFFSNAFLLCWNEAPKFFLMCPSIYFRTCSASMLDLGLLSNTRQRLFSIQRRCLLLDGSAEFTVFKFLGDSSLHSEKCSYKTGFNGKNWFVERFVNLMHCDVEIFKWQSQFSFITVNNLISSCLETWNVTQFKTETNTYSSCLLSINTSRDQTSWSDFYLLRHDLRWTQQVKNNHESTLRIDAVECQLTHSTCFVL